VLTDNEKVVMRNERNWKMREIGNWEIGNFFRARAKNHQSNLEQKHVSGIFDFDSSLEIEQKATNQNKKQKN
jgi:hypothetical protein